MRIRKNVLEKENLDSLIKVTRLMSPWLEEKNITLSSDQKNLLQDLFKWLSETQHSSQVPGQRMIDSIFYPIARDLNRIAAILEEAKMENNFPEKFVEMLKLIYDDYQLDTTMNQSEAAHFLIYWTEKEIVNKFEGPYAESLKEKTGHSNVSTNYHDHITEAKKNPTSNILIRREFDRQILMYGIPACFPNMPDRLFYPTFKVKNGELGINFGPGKSGDELRNKYIKLWGIPEDRDPLTKQYSGKEYDKSYGNGIFYTYEKNPGSVYWNEKKFERPDVFAEVSDGRVFMTTFLHTGPVPSVLVRESVRSGLEKMLGLKHQSDEKKAEFNINGSFFSALSSDPSSLPNSGTPLDLNHPQKIKIFIFYLTHTLALIPKAGDTDPMKFDSLTISNFEKKELGFTAFAEMQTKLPLNELRASISNLLSGFPYNPYHMQVMRVINYEFTYYQKQPHHPIKIFRDEHLEKLKNVTNSDTALKYLKDLLDDILVFTFTADRLLSVTDKGAITKTKESAEKLIKDLEELDEIAKNENIVLTM